eukprot:c16571_g1_i1 orf=59-3652(+)
MALAPAALLLRPVPSLEQQPLTASISSASLVSSSSSHGSFSLFLHHRRPQSFRPAIPRITQVLEIPKQDAEDSFVPAKPSRRVKNPPPWQQKKASNVASDDERSQNPPLWQRKSFDTASVDASDAKPHSFRPAPWQQGSRDLPSSPARGAPWEQGSFDKDSQGKIDGMPARPINSESDKSAMARIVEKLRTIQKTYDPADRIKTEHRATYDSAGRGRGGVTYHSTDGAKTGQRATNNSAYRGRTGQRATNDRSQHGRIGQKTTGPDRLDRVASGQGRVATETYPSKTNTKATPNGKGSSVQAELLVSETRSDTMDSKFPWDRDEKAKQMENLTKKKGPRVPTLAELTLPREELKRLRLMGLQLQERLRIGKLGVTKNIVISIHEQFRTCELVKVRCEGPAAASIKRTHLELEKMTGGMVVLRTGKIIVVYRGSDYNAGRNSIASSLEGKVEDLISRESRVDVQAEFPLPDKYEGSVPQNETVSEEGDTAGRVASTANVSTPFDLKAQKESEMEAERILEGLGPRYDKWAGLLPIPVDADLLPPVIANYRAPFRLMPYGVNPRLSNTELTNLRRLARPLAPHFVLGRNRGHHGLAAAMVKLWEKSEIAKIAVKKGVQNTNNLIMSDELKRLTGGVLLSRDKFFVTFYRGKDFIPEKVAAALVEREASVRDLQELEEKAREERSIAVKWTPATKPSMAVIGKEASEVKPSWVHTMDAAEQNRLKREVAKLQRITLARQMEKKLGTALKKKEKAEQELKKVEVFLKPIDRPIDVETITEEERFMFRKLGLRMGAYLLMGRRGVFDGVVENMHLHWKHRELVKIVVKEADEMQVQETARMLEYESGGILVAVAATRKGQAIIMYRGKNYQRPMELRPRNLLTKRKALKRSLEMQRHESLSQHIKGLEMQILTIQGELKKLSQADDVDDGSLRERLDNSRKDLPSSEAERDGPVNTEENELTTEERKETTLTKIKDTGSTLIITEMDRNFFQEKIKKLERLVRSGPIYRADPLTNPERLRLRKEALCSGRAPEFFIGKNNGLEGVARGIRIFFLHHALAKIVVKGRTPGMLMEDLVHDLEELTGGVLVSQEANKIIMYRGWPKGDEVPFAESLENLTPELLSALEAEEDFDADTLEDYMVGGKVEKADEFELEDDQDWSDALLDGDEEEEVARALYSSHDLQLKFDGSAEDEDEDEEEDEEQ